MSKDKQRREPRKPKKKTPKAPPAPAIRIPTKGDDKRS